MQKDDKILAVGTATLIGILALAAFYSTLPGRSVAAGSEQPAAVREPIPRRQFSILVYDKNQEDVIRTMGKPDATSEYQGIPFWYYARRTYDPITGKVDVQAKLMFGDGAHVTSIDY